MQDALPKSKKKAANTIDAPIRGTEFVMPVNGFFCRLCKEFFGDGLCASEHLKTSKHNRAYEKLVEEDTYYEKRLTIEKAAGRAQKLKMAVYQERDQKRKQDEDETEGEDDTPSKKAKTEQEDTKMSPATGQKGFGVFSKTEAEKQIPKAKGESPAASQVQTKPEKTPPAVSKPSQVVPPPSQPSVSEPSTAPTQAEKKAALAAKLAPMVGKMRGPSSKFLLRKTAAPKGPQPSKLVAQNLFTDSSKKTLTFDTLPVVKDKPVDVKKNLEAVHLTQTDIADAFKGKHIEEKRTLEEPKAAPKQTPLITTAKAQLTPSPITKAPAWPQAQAKQKQGMFGPALPPPVSPPGFLPRSVSLEDMDEDDVCVPGMDDDVQTLPNFLPKPKPPPPVSSNSASVTTSASALASSTATNLYNIFYND